MVYQSRACARQVQRTKKLTTAALRFANNVHLTERSNHGLNSRGSARGWRKVASKSTSTHALLPAMSSITLETRAVDSFFLHDNTEISRSEEWHCALLPSFVACPRWHPHASESSCNNSSCSTGTPKGDELHHTTWKLLFFTLSVSCLSFASTGHRGLKMMNTPQLHVQCWLFLTQISFVRHFPMNCGCHSYSP